MNLKRLKEILDSREPDNVKEHLIIQCLSKDEKVIPTIMKILGSERDEKKQLILDMNLELSRAHIYIDERPENKAEAKQSFNKSFVIDEIGKFYFKYKGIIGHCFNRFK